MNAAASVFETQMRAFCKDLGDAIAFARQIKKQWSSTDAQGLVTALGSNDNQATISTGLDKGIMFDMISVTTEMDLFASGAAQPDQGDWLAACEKAQEKKIEDELTEVLSHSTEAIGEYMKALGKDLIDLYQRAVALDKIYNSNSIGTAAEALDGKLVFFGIDSTVDKLKAAAGMNTRFLQLLSGSARPAQADNLAVIVTWVG